MSSGEDSDSDNTPELRGYLSKWTNYIHGWQPRYVVLKDGTLSYYKSESDSDYGCRGAIGLHKATITSHEFDENRFDIAVNNCVWYLRAETPEDKIHWIEVLQSYKTESSTPENVSLRRHGSTLSIESNNLSTESTNSLKRTQRNLREKINEIETFKDILYGQIENLQKYFDACATMENNDKIIPQNGIKPVDFKGESITFKATTSGVMITLQHCLDIITQKEELWKQKLDKEIEKRKRVEELCKKFKDELEKIKNSSYPGPDLEEGPHSTILEDEFFDALETGLDKIEEDRQLRVKLKFQTQQSHTSTSSSLPGDNTELLEELNKESKPVDHPLWPEINRICEEQLHYAREGVGESTNGWQLFADEGEMKMYKREEEVNGMVVDPLKACHMVKGVTAKEMCHFFFFPEYRHDWETTLEECTVIERVSTDTLIFLQTHKRVWPASQRDALFWSHMTKITDKKDEGAYDTWIVCNNSTEHPNYPANTGKCIRLFLTVILVCNTYVNKDKNKSGPITRDDLTCKITYCSVVNPGGWAPATVLRAVYKREYPKFLKRYTQYVIEQCKDNPIMF
ncbi:ceramide transfer protein [Condylostylus longicornis]|uniref:ceramide transfer protein n=1 Tax=Condylostylus longicornis TaxID=2530218 RepID=UPI00244E080F|nr:ceramide transfer protein [Condylostylus longicornis]